MNIIQSDFDFRAMTPMGTPNEIILHHRAGNGDVLSIHRYHKDVNGWAGIGYHFYIRKDGSVYAGRPTNKVGAHATGHNSRSFGVCFEGNFMNEEMTLAQIQAGSELVNYLRGIYNINLVRKHSDVNATSCPGTHFPFERITGNVPHNTINETIPSPFPDNGGYVTLKVDGIWGEATTTELQKHFVCKVIDGIISNQMDVYKSICPGIICASWRTVEDARARGGSPLVKLMERWLGINEDGFIGNIFITTLQGKMGTKQDGVLSGNGGSTCIKELQIRLNNGTL